MADYASIFDRFVAAGAAVVALSVDPPQTSAALRHDLKIGFPLISDTAREAITEWGLLNQREGDIAIPATYLLDRSRAVRFREVEEMTRRIAPADMLEMARALAAGTPPAPPSRRVLFPGVMFLRAVMNGFRHGVRVKRG